MEAAFHASRATGSRPCARGACDKLSRFSIGRGENNIHDCMPVPMLSNSTMIPFNITRLFIASCGHERLVRGGNYPAYVSGDDSDSFACRVELSQQNESVHRLRPAKDKQAKRVKAGANSFSI